MTDHQIKSVDNRIISFADYGMPTGIPVLHCHGGPGSRVQAKRLAEAATAAGFRFIGVDRPGYGASTPYPGRSIGNWTQDALAVADHLGCERFMVVGVSTGGSYALATASVAPSRVIGVLVCCGMTDMRWADGVDEARMDGAKPIWNAVARDAAIAEARAQFGDKGEKMLAPEPGAPLTLSPPDLAFVMDPAFAQTDPDNEPFRQGLAGYADDRIADGPKHGWSSFDVRAVTCPVMVIHGEQDWIVPIAHAHHTASLLRNIELKTFPQHGHLSVSSEIIGALTQLYSRCN